jgi:ADP-ribosylglycohydrolase
MFDKNRIKDIILSSLVADAYSLGAHWIYDENQLKSLDLDWNDLNNAKAIWHKNKSAGDFTHYGDQTYWLYQFLQNKESFDPISYIDFWKSKIEVYNGYIDGSTRETLQNIDDEVVPTGSNSTDLSIIGRISPLLLVSNSKDDFLENVESFVKCTHNSPEAIVSSKFFATLLFEVLLGNEIEESILSLKDSFDTKIQAYVYSGIASKTDDTFETIRAFGSACDIQGGFEGVIHLICKYDNFKDLLVCNARAGGDSSARGMIAATILMAQKNNMNQIPNTWLNIKAKIT